MAVATTPSPSDDIGRIKRNVAKMVAQNAPEKDIDEYIASEGTTIDAVKNFKATPEPDATMGDRVTAAAGGYLDAFPLTRRIAGYGAAGAADAINYARNKINGNEDQPYFDLAEGLSAADKTIDEAKEKSPGAYYGGLGTGIIGSIAAGAPPALDAAKEAGLARSLAVGASGGVASGVLSGADRSRNMEELPGNIENDATIGGLIGLGAPAAVAGVRAIPGAAKNLGTAAIDLGKAAIEKATPVAEKLADKAAPVATKVVKGVDDVIQGTADNISRKISRADLPEGSKDLSDAEALFVKGLQDAGISPEDALKSLKAAKDAGVTPAVSVVNNVEKMNRQADLTARASGGSKVAQDALKDLEQNQIPKINDKLISDATGGKSLSAEDYGSTVVQEAKNLVNAKVQMLKTRAAPHYEASIGLDKSVPETNPEFQKVLANPTAVKALEEWRSDPNVLTNVKNDLNDLGVNTDDIEKLPYNSTVALHAARVALRKAGDRAGGQDAKAIRSAMNTIDEAVESEYPAYKQARKIYSEDAGALKTLKDSPVGRMATMADGTYSQVANNLMQRDPAYIRKVVNGFEGSGADAQKLRDGLAGAYLRNSLETGASDKSFRNVILKNYKKRENLRALVGDDRFGQVMKYQEILNDLVRTSQITKNSVTSANQLARESGMASVPTSKADVIASIKSKIAPSLFDVVAKNPEQAARFNQLMFTDEGYKLLERLSKRGKPSPNDYRAVGKFIKNHQDEIINGADDADIPTIEVRPQGDK